MVLYEIHVAYVDLTHAFFLIAGFLWMMRARLADSDADKALLLAGLCGGMMAGVKLSGIVGAAVLAVLYLPKLIAAAKNGELTAEILGFVRRFALPVVAFWVPWLVKTA